MTKEVCRVVWSNKDTFTTRTIKYGNVMSYEVPCGAAGFTLIGELYSQGWEIITHVEYNSIETYTLHREIIHVEKASPLEI